jgi:hypothetical protein
MYRGFSNALAVAMRGAEAIGPGAGQGSGSAQRFGIGAILLYQLALFYRCQHQLTRRVSLKAFLKTT